MSATSAGFTAGEGAYEASDAHLKQQIGLFGLIALAVSVQIGSGWLLATLAAAGIAGPASILTWVLGAAFFAVIGITWMELGAMLPRSGAGVRLPRLTHGAFLSWFNGWAYLIAALSLPVIESQAVLTYVGGHWHGLGFLKVVNGTTVLSLRGTAVGFVMMFVFFLLNAFGAKLLSESNKIVTIWKLVIPTITAILMFTAFDSANFTIGGGFTPLGGGAVLGALATGGIVFAYSGLRQILDFGGEVQNPQRNIPIAIVVGGILIPLVVYLVLEVAFIGALNWHAAGVHPGHWAGLKGSHWASAPLLNAVTAAGFGWFGTVLLTDAALSPSATAWVWLGIGTRTAYAMSVNSELPKPLQKINRFGTPIVALAACAILGVLFFFPAPSWYLFVGMVSIALTLSYVMGGPVLAVLRRTAPDLPRPVKIPAVNFCAAAGYTASLLLIYFAGWAAADAGDSATSTIATRTETRSGGITHLPAWGMAVGRMVVRDLLLLDRGNHRRVHCGPVRGQQRGRAPAHPRRGVAGAHHPGAFAGRLLRPVRSEASVADLQPVRHHPDDRDRLGLVRLGGAGGWPDRGAHEHPRSRGG